MGSRWFEPRFWLCSLSMEPTSAPSLDSRELWVLVIARSCSWGSLVSNSSHFLMSCDSLRVSDTTSLVFCRCLINSARAFEWALSMRTNSCACRDLSFSRLYLCLDLESERERTVSYSAWSALSAVILHSFLIFPAFSSASLPCSSILFASLLATSISIPIPLLPVYKRLILVDLWDIDTSDAADSGTDVTDRASSSSDSIARGGISFCSHIFIRSSASSDGVDPRFSGSLDVHEVSLVIEATVVGFSLVAFARTFSLSERWYDLVGAFVIGTSILVNVVGLCLVSLFDFVDDVVDILAVLDVYDDMLMGLVLGVMYLKQVAGVNDMTLILCLECSMLISRYSALCGKYWNSVGAR